MTRVLLNVLVIFCVFAFPSFADTPDEPCIYGQPVTVWEPGMYWTYETVSTDTSNYVSTPGSMTFILLAPGEGLLNHRWSVGVITEWADGSPILHPTSASELPSVACVPGLAWPVIVDHIPPSPIAPLYGNLHSQLKVLWFPWVLTEGALAFEAQPREDVRESAELRVAGYESVNTPAGVFEESARSAFSWSVSVQSIGLSSMEGTAWWSQELQWWIRAEGTLSDGGAPRSFEASLIDWGVLTPDELASELGGALSSTSRIDDEWAAGMADLLDQLGVSYTNP